jgi:hypothetical protein
LNMAIRVAIVGWELLYTSFSYINTLEQGSMV